MKLSKEEVEHVAKLARLAVSEEEKEAFSRQLSEILTYVGKLNELDTSKVEPTSHVLDLSNIFRDDVVRESLPPADVLANAPDRENNHFRVPKIIEERE
ncbi:MAG: Asp-tRNA(Asn)/Glu-tRNA(Gln) amidotransferase subunit GatC [Nitrospirae bacterium]|nr:Asp-tRNA(Asn)/Glu-tRNA(Gln) amidotransferase subunit GatC [Nitrospirota bacterium]